MRNKESGSDVNLTLGLLSAVLYSKHFIRENGGFYAVPGAALLDAKMRPGGLRQCGQVSNGESYPLCQGTSFFRCCSLSYLNP